MSIVEAFWSASMPGHRRLMLDEAASRRSGIATFEFDTDDVVLDFDGATATVIDVLFGSASETVPLAVFLDRAASFRDDPSLGDGLSVLQRNPPRFRVAADGDVQPTGNEG
jgi:hypothetical protein